MLSRFLFRRAVPVFGALLLFTGCAYTQALPPPSSSPSTDPITGRERDKKNDPYGSMEDETRDKLIIREEKKRYEENVGRAQEVAQLASQVRESYDARKSLTSDDNKRLERLEKLTKRIRNEAGGSDAGLDEDDKSSPSTMTDAMQRISDWASELQKLVEKTPRQVVSAAVIDQANKLIGLVQRLRELK